MKRRRIHRVHIHQARLRQDLPAVIDRTSRPGREYTRRLEIICPCGCGEVAAVVVQHDQPDSCGARCVVECWETRNGEAP